MTETPAPLPPLGPEILNRIDAWSDPARQRLLTLRRLFHAVATEAKTGPLEESLKWGQPAWRPRKPRTGSTLRLSWSPAAADHLMAYVDCKTDLAARMRTRFPELAGNDGRRALGFDLGDDDTEAIWQLAYLTFTYHRAKRG